ncbi:YafY family transcriptional regulator [Brucella pseudogrignonensis]|jgi:predicted DNA-binding transcriptional regulator YafY|uniref:helix-turn-helix transcriptional regulator n=1 Tax=Brucella pseudogrignonensis TaxID=419475 RepID=UPI000CFC9F79|nr:YafY family protein [Brucella pseudogrignonensis]MBO1023331.1 YafY family transcriptional regulator [Ochrobactrum sp. SD129]MQP39304.1 WYL domain-containing protein [Ochrobactrum sp. MYb237]MCD4513757.1 YafY family transcriptional regulator [Brucella pseudogrignonensis]PQZ43879.1 DNA-binding transcriptional regulator [Brucella pseudogrignonensis]PRA43627.1 DNA-binding transcriptional regulator [Brucella pseudogrignonensis]
MKTLRLFSLLDRLRSASTPVSAEALADMLEVSPRTIYRDMATLVAMGAPVRGEAGLGYQLEKGYFLPPLHFDADELEAIMLGVRLVMARGDGDLGAAAQRVSGKISSTMQAGAGDRYKNLPLRAVSKLTEEHSKANLHLSFLRRAVRDRVVVTLEYLDLKDNITERIVRPLGLTMFDAVWLLTGWCESRNDFRNFRLDRISKVETAGQVFRHQKGQRFEDYLLTL